ncbi:hypothetical protein [Streptomyces sp. NPDC059076]|uniref:hypothetical protein n=1 Tax=unclassified Streptomyces TaxID=2593676 RepID=UPI0036BF9A4B
MEWLIAAGLHPRANATTLAIARDLAARMDFDTGHVRYCLDEVAARLGIDPSTVKRHVAYLRELGALVWVEHGTKKNVRRALGLDGYAATATVYAAVIPAAYDHAMGHHIIGTGYDARIVIDQRDRTPEPVDNCPVDNSGSTPSAPPSLMWLRRESQVKVVGGEGTTTAQARTAESSPRRKKRKLTITGYKITAQRIEQARHLAVSVRPLVNWIQGATHDQLSWVFLDLTAKNWSQPKIVLWLQRLGDEVGAKRWRPRFPHRVIAAALRRLDQADAEQAILHGPDEPRRHVTGPNGDFLEARTVLKSGAVQEPYEEYPSVQEEPEDTWDLAALREAAAKAPDLVLALAHLEGRDEAIRVYGTAAIAIIDSALEDARAGFGAGAVSQQGV